MIKRFLVTVLSCFLMLNIYSQTCAVARATPEIEEKDVSTALKILGVEINKYWLISHDTLKFNLLYQEFQEGRCIDSSFLLTEQLIHGYEQIFHQQITITNDSSMILSLFCKKENDSSYSILGGYGPDLGVGCLQKKISYSPALWGNHECYTFGSPKIKGKGRYLVMLVAPAWESKIGDQKVMRHCYPKDPGAISFLVKHFYAFSVVAE